MARGLIARRRKGLVEGMKGESGYRTILCHWKPRSQGYLRWLDSRLYAVLKDEHASTQSPYGMLTNLEKK